MSTRLLIPLIAGSLLAGTGLAAATDLHDWYAHLLFEPMPLQLQQEQRVQIYTGLSDVEVNRALDEQFERIDSMMFTGVVVTDSAGRPLQDPETGEPLVENDGC